EEPRICAANSDISRKGAGDAPRNCEMGVQSPFTRSNIKQGSIAALFIIQTRSRIRTPNLRSKF
ncbi:MAG: hypothetical protein IKS43_00205, partial [Clostridia bacterium]|nr:hypothetical protein [Clostridia bacterium]